MTRRRNHSKRACASTSTRRFGPTLAAKLPAAGEARCPQEAARRYRGDQLPRVMVMSDAQPRETKILDRGEYLKPTEKVSFATPAFLPPLPEGRPPTARPRAVAGHARASADRPRAGQSDVAAVLRRRDRQDGRGLRRAERVPGPPRAARLAGRRVPRARLEHEGHAPADRHQRHLSPVEPRDARARGARPREPAACPGQPLPHAVAAPARLGAGRHRPARRADRRPPVYPYQPDGIWEALAITKERDFTYPASSGATCIAAASTRSGGGRSARPTCSTPRTGRPAACGPTHDQHAAARPHHAQRPDLGRGRPGAGRADACKAAETVDERLTYAFRRVARPRADGRAISPCCGVPTKSNAAIYAADPGGAKALLAVGRVAARRDARRRPSTPR